MLIPARYAFLTVLSFSVMDYHDELDERVLCGFEDEPPSLLSKGIGRILEFFLLFLPAYQTHTRYVFKSSTTSLPQRTVKMRCLQLSPPMLTCPNHHAVRPR
jgi:hypothetical protein